MEVATALDCLPFPTPAGPLPSSWLNLTIPQFRPISNNYRLQHAAGLLNVADTDNDAESSELTEAETAEVEFERISRIAEHVVRNCPRLRLLGLTLRSTTPPPPSDPPIEIMTVIFQDLKTSRDRLHNLLTENFPEAPSSWGIDGRLLLKMGRSDDFTVALGQGSDIVSVGKAIFGDI